MPSQLHEVFIARVVEEIQNNLRTFAHAESPSRAFAQQIKHNGSGRIDLPSEDDDGQSITKREPDVTFKHRDARWPGVILEVSYSKKKKDLPHLAEDYILGTYGSVRVVVGLDVDYKTRKGTISVWRPIFVRNERGLELQAAQTVDAQACLSPFSIAAPQAKKD